MLGSTVDAQLTPAAGNGVECGCTDFGRGRQHFGEIVEVTPPVPIAHREEEILLGGEVLVDGALRVTGRTRDVIETCWRKTFFGEHLLGGVQQQSTRALEASLPCPLLDHALILSQNLRTLSDTEILGGILAPSDESRTSNEGAVSDLSNKK